MAQIVTSPQGALYVHPHAPRIWSVETEYTAQQTDAVVKLGVSGQSLYITDLTIICNAAVTVTLKEGTSIIRFKFYGSAQADGVARSYIVPKKLKPGASLTVTTSAAVTVYVEVHGYTSP